MKDDHGDLIPYLPFADNNFNRVFGGENKSILYKFLLRRLTSAIEKNQAGINLFFFGPTKQVARIQKSKFEEQLNILIDFYVSLEDYESAGKCKSLIEKHRMNQ